MTIPKHIREALRLAGVVAAVERGRGGHFHLRLADGRRVTASCTPADPYGAAWQIARRLTK